MQDAGCSLGSWGELSLGYQLQFQRRILGILGIIGMVGMFGRSCRNYVCILFFGKSEGSPLLSSQAGIERGFLRQCKGDTRRNQGDVEPIKTSCLPHP